MDFLWLPPREELNQTLDAFRQKSLQGEQMGLTERNVPFDF